MTDQVFLFNASPTHLSLIINNGDKVTLAAAAVNQHWYPMPAAPPPPFSGGQPARGAFGYGRNTCALTPVNGSQTTVVEICIPTDISPTDALQLYLFYVDADHVSWVLLDNGSAASGDIQLPA